jgi:hypothetical protein
VGPLLPGDTGAIRPAPESARELILNFDSRNATGEAQSMSRELLPQVQPGPQGPKPQPTPRDQLDRRKEELLKQQLVDGLEAPQSAPGTNSNVAEGSLKSTKYPRDKARQERR